MVEFSRAISDEILLEIERLSSLFLSPKEIALFLKLDYSFFILNLKDSKTDIYYYYNMGKLKTKIELRENIIKLAKHGSPHAQEMAKDFIKSQKTSEINH
jgi:hypothetical protein